MLRKVLLLVVCVSASLVMPRSSAQIVSNVFTRVLLIKTPAGEGTAFTLDVDSRQYLVTAKHLVGGLNGKSTISST